MVSRATWNLRNELQTTGNQIQNGGRNGTDLFWFPSRLGTNRGGYCMVDHMNDADQQQFEYEVMRKNYGINSGMFSQENNGNHKRRTKMEKSDSIKELAEALAKAQGTIEGAVKDSANPFFKSKYADLSSVVAAIRWPLAKNGLSYTQILHDADNAVCVETIIMHSSGEWLSTGRLTVPVSKLDAQGFGSALTYTRRYSLSAAFGVAPEDDDGNAAASAKPITVDVWEQMDEGQKTALMDIALNVIALLTEGDPAGANAYLHKQDLSADEKVAIWSRFDSKQRSAMKKAAKPTADDLANTP